MIFSLWFLLYTVYLTFHFFNPFVIITGSNYHPHFGNVLDWKEGKNPSFIICFLETLLWSPCLQSCIHSCKLETFVLLETNYYLCFHPSSFKYWIGQTVCSAFSVQSYKKKTLVNFLANPISQWFSMSFKVKVKHLCMAYTTLYNLALPDLISLSLGSWRPFIWSYSLFLWSLCSHCCHALASWTPLFSLPCGQPLLLFIQESTQGHLTPEILPWPNLLPTYWSGAPYIGSEERFIIEMKEVKASDNMQYTMVSQ